MAKKFFTSESLNTLINEIKTYVSRITTEKADKTHKHTKSEITDFPTIPTKTSDLVNDSGFATANDNTSYDFSASTNSINGNVNLKLNGSDDTTDSVVIMGTGGTTVTTDSYGTIFVDSNKITMKTWSSSDIV